MVIEMTADMEEDDVDRELDRLIAELSPAAQVRRLALGSNG